MGPRAPHGVRVWVIFTNWNGLQRGTLILFALFFFFLEDCTDWGLREALKSRKQTNPLGR